MNTIKNFLRIKLENIITRLYYKLKCHQREKWASNMIMYTFPGSLAYKDLTVMLAKIEEQTNREISLRPLASWNTLRGTLHDESTAEDLK